jgi:hypothetical protein
MRRRVRRERRRRQVPSQADRAIRFGRPMVVSAGTVTRLSVQRSLENPVAYSTLV